jgi:hypothetical protein
MALTLRDVAQRCLDVTGRISVKWSFPARLLSCVRSVTEPKESAGQGIGAAQCGHGPHPDLGRSPVRP